MNILFFQLQKMEYAVDFTVSASPSTLKCIEDAHYSTVFIQVYKPSNGGSVNTDGIQNLISVGTTNLGTEVYVTPTTSGKTGQQMFDESYEALKASGIVLRTIWIQVKFAFEGKTRDPRGSIFRLQHPSTGHLISKPMSISSAVSSLELR